MNYCQQISYKYQSSFDLEPNHTHFIFSDDGTEDEIGAERVLRSKIENYFNKLKPTYFDASTKLIYIVIDGDLETLEKIQHAVSNDIPVLILAVI